MASVMQKSPFASYGFIQMPDRLPPIDFEAARAVPISSVIGSSVALKRFGREFRACCPFHTDKTPSFYVNDEKGFYHCFGCGAHGDVIDWMVETAGVGIREAAEMIAGASYPVIQHRPVHIEPEPDRSAEAEKIWTDAIPADGTVAALYLANRGLDGPVPPCIRFSRLRLGRHPVMPTLVALVVGSDGSPTGIQRTFLSENGRKADLPDGKVKFSLGRVKGGAIRCAPADDEVATCEGLEDALSFQRMFGVPTWAAAGAGMMPSMLLPDTIRNVIIGADADEAGERSARAAGETFAGQGRSARIVRPQAPHKDHNAELMAAGRESY